MAGWRRAQGKDRDNHLGRLGTNCPWVSSTSASLCEALLLSVTLILVLGAPQKPCLYPSTGKKLGWQPRVLIPPSKGQEKNVRPHPMPCKISAQVGQELSSQVPAILPHRRGPRGLEAGTLSPTALPCGSESDIRCARSLHPQLLNPRKKVILSFSGLS